MGYTLIKLRLKKPEAGERLILDEPKSEASKRAVYLPDFALAALRDHMEGDQVVSEYVFHTSKGTPYSPRNATKYFKMVLKKARLPDTIGRIRKMEHKRQKETPRYRLR